MVVSVSQPIAAKGNEPCTSLRDGRSQAKKMQPSIVSHSAKPLPTTCTPRSASHGSSQRGSTPSRRPNTRHGPAERPKRLCRPELAPTAPNAPEPGSAQRAARRAARATCEKPAAAGHRGHGPGGVRAAVRPPPPRPVLPGRGGRGGAARGRGARRGGLKSWRHVRPAADDAVQARPERQARALVPHQRGRRDARVGGAGHRGRAARPADQGALPGAAARARLHCKCSALSPVSRYCPSLSSSPSPCSSSL